MLCFLFVLRGGRCSCMGSVSVVMQMLYVCVLCAACGSSQCCVPHVSFCSPHPVTVSALGGCMSAV